MYENPINIICDDIQHKVVEDFDKKVLNVVQSYGIDVNKEELLKALQYDRQQYEKGYADAKSEQRWIPCTERLPEIKEHHTSEPCIVYCDNEVYAFAELEENIFGQVGWNCERDDDYHEAVGTVIAWMPLPEPWRGEEHETD